MKTYFVSTTEFARVLHGNRSIKIQKPVRIGEWVLFVCNDTRKYSAPVQARVKSLYDGVFKTRIAEGVSEFPFPIERSDE